MCVQYRGGCSVLWGIQYRHKYRGGYLEYRGGVQYCGGYHEYRGGYHVYEFLCKKFKPPTAKAKISAKLKITEDLWPQIYTMASKWTLDTKAKISQFKILNKVYISKQMTLQNESVRKSIVFVMP